MFSTGMSEVLLFIKETFQPPLQNIISSFRQLHCLRRYTTHHMTTDILQFPLGPELSSHVWFIELFEADKKRKSQADAK